MKLFRTLILTILAAGAKDGPERLDVIPHPNSVEYGKGHFKAAGAIFNCETGIDERSLAAIRDFAEKMTYVSGYTSTVAVPGGSLLIGEKVELASGIDQDFQPPLRGEGAVVDAENEADAGLAPPVYPLYRVLVFFQDRLRVLEGDDSALVHPGLAFHCSRPSMMR